MNEDVRFAEISRKKNNLWIISLRSVEPSTKQFEDFLNHLYTLYSQNSQLILIFDGSRVRYINTKLRKLYAQWMEHYEDMIVSTCIQHIYVSNNLVTNYIIKELFLSQYPPIRFIRVRTIDEALKKAFESGNVSYYR